MNYTYSMQTNPGLVRTNNEDAALFDDRAGVAVLADGMGGYNAGEIASGMATTFLMSELIRWLSVVTYDVGPDPITHAIELCVSKTNLSIFNAANSNPQYAGMGTTLVLGIFQGNYLVLGHVGDSRCYRLRDGVLSQITKDHSMLQEQVDAGLLTVQQASTAPGKNLLTRALGVDETVQVEVHTHTVKAYDLYLMCSDGLTDMVTDAQMADILKIPSDLSEIASALVHKAIAGGGRDNITVLLTRAQPSQEKPGLLSRLLGRTATN